VSLQAADGGASLSVPQQRAVPCRLREVDAHSRRGRRCLRLLLLCRRTPGGARTAAGSHHTRDHDPLLMNAYFLIHVIKAARFVPSLRGSF